VRGEPPPGCVCSTQIFKSGSGPTCDQVIEEQRVKLRRLRQAADKVWAWSCGEADLSVLREGLDALRTDEKE